MADLDYEIKALRDYATKVTGLLAERGFAGFDIFYRDDQQEALIVSDSAGSGKVVVCSVRLGDRPNYIEIERARAWQVLEGT